MSINVTKRNNINIVGNPDASQTIVFGHGFGSSQEAFNYILPYFEKDYRIILYDNTGGGKSDLAAFNNAKYSSLQGYVLDLVDIFRALELKDVIYVGHSVNGMVSLLTSIRYPEFFKKLVLVGASPRYLNDDSAGYTGGFTQEALEGLYDTMRSNYKAWTAGFSAMVMAAPERPDLVSEFAATLADIRPDIALFVAKVIFESDYRSELQKATVPTLLIHAKEDVAVPLVVGDYLHEHIKNSQLHVVDAYGHFPHMSAPDAVVKAITDFI
ncbi:alpha/beta hydrolase [Chitinophaga horti]|uniref:Alpha/beta hydrolase n=1 Tax=Chitinophaga horti TaxID=2920382 RepID=A0ABY6J7K0_9BACT|nr:alpha/beta hydrolase [Chitinophaga horti]UYQ95311.1 alpha/beta hydrolase [Chitinophaga horti]